MKLNWIVLSWCCKTILNKQNKLTLICWSCTKTIADYYFLIFDYSEKGKNILIINLTSTTYIIHSRYFAFTTVQLGLLFTISDGTYIHYRPDIHTAPRREKSHENQYDAQHLFVDYKSAFNSRKREHILAAMSKLGISAKLPVTPLRQEKTPSNPLSSDLFNFIIEECSAKSRSKSKNHHWATQTRCYSCL